LRPVCLRSEKARRGPPAILSKIALDLLLSWLLELGRCCGILCALSCMFFSLLSLIYMVVHGMTVSCFSPGCEQLLAPVLLPGCLAMCCCAKRQSYRAG